MADEKKRYEQWERDTPPEGRALIPAATVILLRDQEHGIETLMLRRNSKLKFVGGMWVFPGGRLDPGDQRADDEDEQLAYRRAAAREAGEEAGLSVAPESMQPFAHWTPPPITPKRFSTWFFMARAPEGHVTIDGGEIHDHRWVRPGDAMDLRDRGEIEVAPPTWVTLDGLARHDTVESALAAAGAEPPRFFSTKIAMTDAGPIALWQGDAGYASADPTAAGHRHRLEMVKGPWKYERSV